MVDDFDEGVSYVKEMDLLKQNRIQDINIIDFNAA